MAFSFKAADFTAMFFLRLRASPLRPLGLNSLGSLFDGFGSRGTSAELDGPRRGLRQLHCHTASSPLADGLPKNP
jgi:hypothetical protein